MWRARRMDWEMPSLAPTNLASPFASHRRRWSSQSSRRDREAARWLTRRVLLLAPGISLTSEFEPLLDDVDASLAWADAAFGRKPSAVNFWLGEDAARTTAHADLYDNLYVVLKGTKEFTLLPPQEGHRLDRARYRAGTYAADLTLELDTPTNFVHWTQIDLESEEAARKLRPVRATVGPGELLFLPALWWHAVSQRGSREEGADCSTVAVNYWYEGFVAMGDEADAAAERAALRLLSEVSGVDLLSGM